MTPRPRFFDLLRIRFPIGAVASFLHRVSGLLLVLALPLLAEAFGRSLAGQAGFDEVTQALRGWPAALAAVVLAWALTHHVLAGIRHLAMDAGIGWRLGQARTSATWVIAAGIAVAAALAAWLAR